MEGTARCFYSDRGRLVRLLGTNVDVTERDERETALASRESQLRSILQTVPDAMIIIDDQGIITDFSAAAEQMFHYPATQAVGRNIAMLMSAQQGAAHDSYIERYLATGVRRVIGRVREFRARRADGSEFPVELSVGEAFNDGQRLFIGFIRDVSERAAAEKRLEALNNDYAHVGRVSAMGEVAGGLAHELNQPLAACSNYLGAARYIADASGAGAGLRDNLAKASDQVHRAGEIIRRLRGFIGRRDADSTFESLDAIIGDAVALGMVGSRQHDIHIDVALGPDATMVIVDRVQIQQVLTNLLRNAAEAIRDLPPECRRIRVGSCRIDEGQLEVSVSDRGRGFPEAMLARDYAPFLSTKGPQGMGIGLLICRRIVEAHGGTLTLSNVEGGARVSFTLPSAPAEPGSSR
jgi:two-component system, LuxR family, sensor kinase FixL